MADREVGDYSVKFQGHWAVAYWDGSQWLLGSTTTFQDGDVGRIGPRRFRKGEAK